MKVKELIDELLALPDNCNEYEVRIEYSFENGVGRDQEVKKSIDEIITDDENKEIIL